MPDLTTFDSVHSSDEGAEMTVRHPITDKPLIDEETKDEVTITVAGQDSKVYQEATREAQNRRLGKRLTRKGIKVTAEELEGDAMEVLIRCTLRWKHVILDGQPLECVPKNIRTVYERCPWLREQVDDFLGDRSHYLGNSLMGSSSTRKRSSDQKHPLKVAT